MPSLLAAKRLCCRHFSGPKALCARAHVPSGAFPELLPRSPIQLRSPPSKPCWGGGDAALLGGAESVGNDAQGARRGRAGGHATNQRFLGRMQFVLGRRSATVSWPLIASSATSLNSAENRLRLLMVDYPLS